MSRNKLLTILKKPSTIGIIGIFLTILGTIVPHLYISELPMHWITGDGKILVLLMLFTGFCIWKKKAALSLIPTGLGCAMFASFIYRTTPAKVLEKHLFRIAEYGPGTYLMIIGLCLCLIYGVSGDNYTKEKESEKIPFSFKYFLIGFILPIIGFYLAITKKSIDKIESKNALNGALVGIIIFLIFLLLKGLV